MRDGLRHALLVVAGLLGILFVISFTAWGLTTYGSVRHVVGDIATQTDKAVSLQSQYEEMTIAFAEGGDVFTFRYNGAPVDVSTDMAAGRDRDEVIGLVLDAYTSDIYNGRLTAGGPGFAGVFFNTTGNLIYFLATLITLIAFAAAVAGGILPFKEIPLPDRLMSAGNIVAIICLLAFLLFAFAPGLIKSLAWGYIGNTDAARDILDVLEPALVGSLLRNTLLMLILGGIASGAGFYLDMQDKRQGGSNAAPPTFHYQGPREKQAPYAENRKRRSL